MDLVGNEHEHAHHMLIICSVYALICSLSLPLFGRHADKSLKHGWSVIRLEYVAVACQVRLFLRTLEENPAEGQKAYGDETGDAGRLCRNLYGFIVQATVF